MSAAAVNHKYNGSKCAGRNTVTWRRAAQTSLEKNVLKLQWLQNYEAPPRPKEKHDVFICVPCHRLTSV